MQESISQLEAISLCVQLAVCAKERATTATLRKKIVKFAQVKSTGKREERERERV